MKHIINKLRDGLIVGIGFIFIVGIANAWTGLQASIGDTLTSDKWNELVDLVNQKGKVQQIELLTNSSNINVTSSSFVDLWSMDISDVKSGSKIIGEVSISSLFEGAEEQEWGIFKEGIQIANLKNKNSGITGWGMHNPVIMFEDSNPNVGNNTYILKLRVVGHGWFNYGTSLGNGTSFAKLTEITK